jgi:hypothetical protein
MSKKASLPLRIAPLQRVVAEPITDPAERLALDRIRKWRKRTRGGPKVKLRLNGAKARLRSRAKRRR